MDIDTELNFTNKYLTKHYQLQRPSTLDTHFFIYLIMEQVIQFLQKMHFKLKI